MKHISDTERELIRKGLTVLSATRAGQVWKREIKKLMEKLKGEK